MTTARGPDGQRVFTRKQLHTAPRFLIGQVAEITGATRKAIRHYEALGLLPAAKRQGNYRIYSERDLFLVHMIRHAQSYGFSLAELKELVTVKARQSRFPLKLAEALVKRKRVALRHQVAELRTLDRRLAQLIRDMRRHFG